jgi:hypothetical protein
LLSLLFGGFGSEAQERSARNFLSFGYHFNDNARKSGGPGFMPIENIQTAA